MPGDDPARQFLPGDADETLRETLGTDTSKESAETNIRADQAQLTLHLRELQIVHANDLGAVGIDDLLVQEVSAEADRLRWHGRLGQDRKSTCLNSSHGSSSYAVFCLKKKNTKWRGNPGSEWIYYCDHRCPSTWISLSILPCCRSFRTVARPTW